MTERGVDVDHSTINRWVIKYSPLLENKFTKRYKAQVGSSWRMDETYVKVKGVWHYLYRAVDKDRVLAMIVCWILFDLRPHLVISFYLKFVSLALAQRVTAGRNLRC